MTQNFTWAGNALDVDAARDQIDTFAIDYGLGPILLALHIAVLERYRADIVALTRREFLPKPFSSDLSADADFLFGPLSWNLGGGYYRMDPEVRRQCLITLDVWGAREGDQIYRSQRVAQFVRRYVSWARRHPPTGLGPAFADYLNTIEWVALGFDDPDEAAMSLAFHMKSQLSSFSGTSAIRLSGLAAVLELPMAAFMDGLNYARAIDALAADDYERAVALVSANRHQEFQMGGEVVPPPREMLARYEAKLHLRQGDSKDSAPTSRSPVADLTQAALSPGTLIKSDVAATDSPLHVVIKEVRESLLSSVDLLLSTSPELLDSHGLQGKTPLHLAAERGNSNLIKLLLDKGAEPDSRDAQMATPLHLAAENGRLEVVDLLIKCADIEARNVKGSTPLAFAAANGHIEVANLLIERGALVDAPNYLGVAPVGYAIQNGRLSMMELLLTHGVDLWRLTSTNANLMYLAAWGGRLAIVERLVDAGLPIDRRGENGWSPFLVAAFFGHAAVVEYLFEIGAYINDEENDGWTALHAAAQEGHPEVIRRLMRFGATIDSQTPKGNYTPLHSAAIHGRHEAVVELLSRGANVNLQAMGMTPLIWACAKGHGEVVRLLLLHPHTDLAATDSRGATALQLAVEAKSESAVRALLEDPRINCNVVNGAFETPPLWQAADRQSWDVFALLCNDPRTDKNWKGPGDHTQLHRSAEKGEVTAVELLLAAGAEVDAINHFPKTPLLNAIGSSSVEIVKTLLAHGANPEGVSPDPEQKPLAAAVAAGFAEGVRLLVQAGAQLKNVVLPQTTLIHQASELKKPEVVDVLISFGFRIDERDSTGSTPLHLAVAHSDSTMVEHLIRAGAQVDCRDQHGLTPLHYAIRMANIETAKELINHGADVKAATLDGWTPLHFAAQRHSKEFIEILIEGVDSLEVYSQTPPMTPLQVAAESGATTIVEHLLAAGADSNASNSRVGAPLLLAVQNGHAATALVLIKAGANQQVVDPVSGVGLIGLFQGRKLKRQLAGLKASEEELELARMLSAAVTAEFATQRGSALVLSDETFENEPLEEWIGPQPNLLTFAPLRSLDFANPEEPVLEPWHALRGRERLKLIERIVGTEEKVSLGADSTQVLWTMLPFYERVSLVRLRDRNWTHPRRALFYLRTDNNLVRLDGKSSAIALVNVYSLPRLTAFTVIEYARFFGFFVRGEDGPFYVLESPDDPELQWLSNDVRTAIRRKVRPPEVTGMSEEGHFMVKATMVYSNSLFLVHLEVQGSGTIQMLADEPLMSDLHETIIDAPILLET